LLHKFIFDGVRIVLDVNSGAVHVVDDLVWDLLDDDRRLPAGEVLEKFSDRYPAEEVEEALSEISRLEAEGLLFSPDPYRGGYAPPPAGVVKALCLHLAHACNLRCRYCFAGQGRYCGDEALMPAETGRAAIDFLIEASGSRRHLEIDFFGGEPLLNAPVLMDLVAYGRRQGSRAGKEIAFTVTTNGVLLTDELAAYLNENQVSAVLSLDGRRTVHDANRRTPGGGGSYDVVLPKIKRFVTSRNGDNYYVRGTFTRFNLDFGADVLHLADLGFEKLSVEPVVAFGGEPYALLESDLPAIEAEYKKLAREIRQRGLQGRPLDFFHFRLDLDGGPCLHKRLSGCGAGSEYLAVTPDGSLYPCHQFADKVEYRLGTVFSGIEKEELREPFRRANIYEKEDCPGCWAKFYCSGGCHANAVSANGTLSKPYGLSCALIKIRLECALYLKVLDQNP
jgi:uncharacterized protein